MLRAFLEGCLSCSDTCPRTRTHTYTHTHTPHTHTHKHTQTHTHAHTVSVFLFLCLCLSVCLCPCLSGPESSNVADSYENFRLSVSSSASDYYTWKEDDNNRCSYIKSVATTAKTVQSQKPQHRHQDNLEKQLHDYHRERKRQQHSNNWG